MTTKATNHKLLIRQVLYNGKKLVQEPRDLRTCLGMADNFFCPSFFNSKLDTWTK